METLTPDQAAAQAINLFSQDARLCERHPNKIARTHLQAVNIKPFKNEKIVPTNDVTSSKAHNHGDNALNNRPVGKFFLIKNFLK